MAISIYWILNIYCAIIIFIMAGDIMNLIQSLKRAFDIINCFDENNVRLKLNDISSMLGLNINTTRGLVNTLVHFCYLEHHIEDNTYSLGFTFKVKYDLMAESNNNIFLNDIDGFLTCLANEYNVNARYHHVNKSTLTKIISKTPKNSRYVIYIKDSNLLPLESTSSGKLILQYMGDDFVRSYLKENYRNSFEEKYKKVQEDISKIEKNGFSDEYDEVELGTSSVAVPIVRDNKLLATISTTGSSEIIRINHQKIIDDIKDYLKVNNLQ